MKNLSTIFRNRIAYPDGFRFHWNMPSYSRRRHTGGFLQIPRMSAFRQVFGDAALLAACQSRRFTNDASDDALRAVLTASRRFRRFDRRTCERANHRETDRWTEQRFRARSNLEEDSFDDALTLNNAVGYLRTNASTTAIIISRFLWAALAHNIVYRCASWLPAAKLSPFTSQNTVNCNWV